MGIEMRVSGDEYCGTIEFIDSTNDFVYFPIIRVENWTTARPSVVRTNHVLFLTSDRWFFRRSLTARLHC